MVNWENSYKYGEKKEKELLPILQEYFGKTLREVKVEGLLNMITLMRKLITNLNQGQTR